MNAEKKTLSALRRSLAGLGPPARAAAAERIPFGLSTIDGPLGGGLARAALHELFAAQGADAAAAAGFAVALSIRALTGRRKIVWVRHDLAGLETGQVHACGLAELGADPDRFILVRAVNALSALRAGNEAARCASLAVVIIELWGEPACLDLTATRRLSLSVGHSGVTAFLLRAGARPRPSAAISRWAVKAAPSSPLIAGAPGHPVFEVSLLRHRHGIACRSWRVEWNRDACRFREPALSRAVAAVPFDRPAAPGAQAEIIRRAG